MYGRVHTCQEYLLGMQMTYGSNLDVQVAIVEIVGTSRSSLIRNQYFGSQNRLGRVVTMCKFLMETNKCT